MRLTTAFPADRYKEVNAMIANQIMIKYVVEHDGTMTPYDTPLIATKSERIMTKERSACEYCKGNTRMDDYGQCRACGAPKPPPPFYYTPQVQKGYGTVTLASTVAPRYAGIW